MLCRAGGISDVTNLTQVCKSIPHLSKTTWQYDDRRLARCRYYCMHYGNISAELRPDRKPILGGNLSCCVESGGSFGHMECINK